MKRILCIACYIMCLQACLKYEFEEKSSVLSADHLQMTLDCDDISGSGQVEDSLLITSNHSWSALVREGVDWIRLDTAGCKILSGVSATSTLPFRLSDNSLDSVRSGKVVIFSEGDSLVIGIRQKAWHAKLLVASTEGFENISALGDTLSLDILSNTSWTVATDPCDNASISFDRNSGNGSATVTVAVAPNPDTSTEKTATINISASGCSSIDIPVHQSKGGVQE